MKNPRAQDQDTNARISRQSSHQSQLGLPWLASGGTDEVRNITEHSQLTFEAIVKKNLRRSDIIVQNPLAQTLDTKSWITLQSNNWFQLGLPWLASRGTEEVRNITEHGQRTFQAIVMKFLVDQKSSSKIQGLKITTSKLGFLINRAINFNSDCLG